jgi:hypothetical protein
VSFFCASAGADGHACMTTDFEHVPKVVMEKYVCVCASWRLVFTRARDMCSRRLVAPSQAEAASVESNIERIQMLDVVFFYSSNGWSLSLVYNRIYWRGLERRRIKQKRGRRV